MYNMYNLYAEGEYESILETKKNVLYNFTYLSINIQTSVEACTSTTQKSLTNQLLTVLTLSATASLSFLLHCYTKTRQSDRRSVPGQENQPSLWYSQCTILLFIKMLENLSEEK